MFELTKRQRRWVKRARPYVRRLSGSVAVEVTDGAQNRTAGEQRTRVKA